MVLENEAVLHFDLVRTIILSKYLCNWGYPKNRIVSKKEGQYPVELYCFPGDVSSKVVRYATVGVSQQKLENDQSNSSHELLLVLPTNLGGASEKEVTDYLLDIMAYSLDSNVKFVPEQTIPESKLSPKIWRQKAILIDEPYGEDDELSEFVIDGRKINLFWIIPIYGAEEKIINKKGVGWFDKAIEKEELSVVDLARNSLA